MTAEKKLLAAVLVRASRDALDLGAAVSRSDKKSAIKFLCLDLVRPYVDTNYCECGFSFGYICEHLELCPYTIHSKLRNFTGTVSDRSVTFRTFMNNIERLFEKESRGIVIHSVR